MNTIQKLAVAGIIAATATAGGCSESSSDEPKKPTTVGSGWGTEDKLYAETITLPDGRVITCVVLENSSKDYSYGGVSCDWDTANGLIPEEER